MWEIWANKLLPNALKSCPKSNKSPNLVTLLMSLINLRRKFKFKAMMFIIGSLHTVEALGQAFSKAYLLGLFN